MEATNKSSSNNDFPVARALNNSLLTITKAVWDNDRRLPEDHECMAELNRVYVLMVHELEMLYSQNSELAGLKPEPFWKLYDVLETKSDEILDYLDEPEVDNGRAHIIKLNKLCIIANNETPVLNSKQKKLVNNTEKAVKNYYIHLHSAMDDIHWTAIADDTSYVLTYENDGRIVVNDILILKKTQVGSAIDELLEQAFKHKYELFIPKLKNTTRNLSTILSSAGFSPMLRQIFFPTVSKTKGVMFRPVVARSEVKSENIDTRALDYLLTHFGAEGIFEDLDTE